MPAFNSERTIAGSINSILTQTYKNWELIIVNDGSEDRTEEVVKKFKDRRIRYFARPRLGIPATCNFGSTKARGDYIVVQGADDYSLPDRLEKISCLRDDYDVIIHGIYTNHWNEQYQCIERQYSPPLLGKKNAIENRINGVPTYKREVWVKRPFREETKYAYDWMMNLDWILSNFRYGSINEGLYEYVRYQGSASDRFEKSGLRADAFNKIKEIVKQEYKTKI